MWNTSEVGRTHASSANTDTTTNSFNAIRITRNRRNSRLLHLNRPCVNLARLHDEEYVQHTYERLYSSSSYTIDGRRKYESTPTEKEWLVQEAYSLNLADSGSGRDSYNNVYNSNNFGGSNSPINKNNINQSISNQVDKMIAEILCDSPSTIDHGTMIGDNNSSNRSNLNSNVIFNTSSLNTGNNNMHFSTPNNSINNLFLERQLLLVKRAQDFLLDEYRIGYQNNNVRTQRNTSNRVKNVEVDEEDNEIDSKSKQQLNHTSGNTSLHIDPSLDDAVDALTEENEDDESGLRDEIDSQASHENVPMRPHLNLSGISSAFTQIEVNNTTHNNNNSSRVHNSSKNFSNRQNTNNKHKFNTKIVVEYKPGPMNHLPVNAQIGIQLFFRLLRTLRFDQNPRVLARIVKQIPKLLANIPPLALADDMISNHNAMNTPPNSSSTSFQAVAVGTPPNLTNKGVNKSGKTTKSNQVAPKTKNTQLGVVDALSHALEITVINAINQKENKLKYEQNIVTPESTNMPPFHKADLSKGNSDGKRNGDLNANNIDNKSTASDDLALASIVGLAIKRGSLSHILKSVLLVLAFDTVDKTLRLPVGQYLKELAEAQHVEVETPLEFGNAKGTLMTFGKGDHGKLGHGKCNHPHCSDGNCTENRAVPSIIQSLENLRITLIDSLSTHSVAVTEDGVLYTWGNGDKHRLGHGTTAKEYLPRPVLALREKPAVVDVACGLGHTIALLVTGEVYSWGNGGNGRLGHGDTQDRSSACIVSMLEGINIIAVFSGASHSLAISEDGSCLSWGKNNQGQCGHGNMTDHLFPLSIELFQTKGEMIAQVAGGWEHTLAISRDGHTYSFGCGYKDSRRDGLPPVLGHGGNDHKLIPEQILALQDENVVHVACGWDHSLAVTAEGLLYTWGAGTNGKLGHGDETDRSLPTCVEGLRGQIVIQAEAGCEHSAALTADGELYTWGHGDSGRLGHGETKSENKPRKLIFPPDVGLNTNDNSSTPGNVNASLKVLSIAVGDKYNMILVNNFDQSEDIGSLKTAAANTSGSNENKKTNAKKPIPNVQLDNNISHNTPISSRWILSNEIFSLNNLSANTGESRKQLAMIFPDDKNINTNLNLIRNDNNNILSTHLPVIVMAHLERLVQPFNSHASLAFKKTLKGATKNTLNMSVGDATSRLNNAIPRFAYCIEPSENTMAYFHAILSKCYDKVEKKNEEYELCRWCIVLCTLRLLKANLQQLVSVLKTEQGKDVSFSNGRSVPHNTTKSISALISSKMSSTFKMLHHLLLLIIKRPIKCDVIDTSGKSEKKSQTATDNTNKNKIFIPSSKAIEIEAGDVIRVGFDFFYPTPASRKNVLRQFMKDDVPNHVLLNAVMDRLSENIVVSHLLQNILPEGLSCIQSSNIDDLRKKKTTNDLASGSLSPQGVDDLLRDLLNRAYVEMDERLSKVDLDKENNDTAPINIFSSPYAKLLLAIQNHVLASWSHVAKLLDIHAKTKQIEQNSIKVKKSGSDNIHDCVLSHGKRLLQTSADCLKRCYKIATRQPLSNSKRSNLRRVMSESFLSAILMPFIAGLSVSPTHPSLATQLLPPMLKLIEVVDTINCQLILSMDDKIDSSKQSITFVTKLTNITKASDKHGATRNAKLTQSHQWEMRLHALLAHFTGKLIVLIMKGHPILATEAALKRWLSSRLLSGGVNQASLTDRNEEVTSYNLNDLSVVLQWKKNSLFSLKAEEILAEKLDDSTVLQNKFLDDLLSGQGDAHQLNILIQESMISGTQHASPLSPSAKSPNKKREISGPPEALAGQRSLRALVSVILKCNGYVTEAISQSKLLSMSRANNIAKEPLSSTLLDVWATAVFLQRLVAVQSKQDTDERSGSSDDTLIYKQARLAADSTPLRNIIPTSDSVASTIVRHCRFLLQVNPAFPIRLIKHGTIDSAWRDLSLFQNSSSHVSLTEVFKFISEPLDITVLREEILRRMERGRVRSVGIDLTKYLLTIISPNFGYVKAQAIAQLPYAMARHREITRDQQKNTAEYAKIGEINVELQRVNHYMADLQSCGSAVSSQVHASFIDLYEHLSRSLIDGASTETFKLAILHSWALKIESPDHLRNSKLAALQIVSPKAKRKKKSAKNDEDSSRGTMDAFGGGLLLAEEEMMEESYDHSMSILCSKILSILGTLLETDGDILSQTSHDAHNKISFNVALHHTAWRIFYLLGIQLCKSKEISLNTGNIHDSSNTNKNYSKTHPLYSVVVHELSRVQVELEKIALDEISFSHLSRKTNLKVIVPGKLWMTRDQPGVVIPESPIVHNLTNKRQEQQNKFAVSFWVRLPKNNGNGDSENKKNVTQNSNGDSNSRKNNNHLYQRRIICVRTDTIKNQEVPHAENDTNNDVTGTNKSDIHVFYPAIFLSYEKKKKHANEMSQEKDYQENNITSQPKIEFVLTTFDVKKNVYINNTLFSTNALNYGQWTHLTCAYDGEQDKMKIYIDGKLCGQTNTKGSPLQSWSKPLHIGSPQHISYNTARNATATFGATLGIIGWISSVWWLHTGLSDTDAKALARVPSPNQSHLKRDIDNYGYRLVTLSLILIRTENGRNGLMENNQCISIMLSLLRSVSGKVQRCILKFLRQTLPFVKPLSVQVPTMSATVGSGLKAAKASRTASGLWKYLSQIVGITWFCDADESKMGLPGTINSVLSQFLPSSFRSGHESTNRDPMLPSSGLYSQITGHRSGTNTSYSQHKRSLADRSALTAGLVALLRQLFISEHWSKVISECMKTSFVRFTDFLLKYLDFDDSEPKISDTTEKQFDWSANRDIIINAVTAIYVLGGLIEQPYIGAKVYYPTASKTSVDFIGSTVSGEDGCAGMIIDIDWKTCMAQVTTANTELDLHQNNAFRGNTKGGLSHQVFPVPLNLLKTVHLEKPESGDILRLNEEVIVSFVNVIQIFLGVNPKKAVPSFTMSAKPAGANSKLPWVESKIIVDRTKHKGTKRVTSTCKDGKTVSGNAIITNYNIILCFVRSRALRALSSVLSQRPAAKYLIETGCLPRLLRASVTDISNAASSATVDTIGVGIDMGPTNSIFGHFQQPDGSDSNLKTSPLYSNAHTLSEKLSTWVSVPAVENIAEEAFGRLHSGILPLPTEMYKCIPRIERIGGKVRIHRTTNCVESISNFPSVRLSNLVLFPVHNIGNMLNLKKSFPPGSVVGGCYYYEAILLSDGLMQIGWADALYKGDPERGQGVGDHPHSWALDGYRCKKWNSSSSDYGTRWRIGDVVGCLINLDSLQLRFTLNGKDLGVAYNTLHSVGGLYPAASFNMQQAARFNFGPPHSEFMHQPPKGYKSIGSALVQAISYRRSNEDVEAHKKSQSKIVQSMPSSEITMKRQELVDNLTTMGFPLDWCIRAANVQQISVMDESSAIAWIIEKMEMENDSIQSQNEDTGGNNSNNSIGNPYELINQIDRHNMSDDDDDEDEDEDNEKDQNLASNNLNKQVMHSGSESSGRNLPSLTPGTDVLGSTINYEDHLLDDEECTEIYAPLAERYFPSPIVDGSSDYGSNMANRVGLTATTTKSGTGPNPNNNDNDTNLMSLINGKLSSLRTDSSSRLTNDAYSTVEILSEIISALQPTNGDGNEVGISASSTSNGSTTNNNDSNKSGILSSAKSLSGNALHVLGNSDDQQELWALSLSTSCALSTIYSRASVLCILKTVLYETTAIENCEKDEERFNISNVLGSVLSSPQCILMFVDFLKLVRFRGPVPRIISNTGTYPRKSTFYYYDELHHLLKPVFKILLNRHNDNDSVAKLGQTDQKNPGRKEKKANDTNSSSAAPLFLTVLVDESLGHFTRARARQYDGMLWISRPVPPIHPFVSSIMTLSCDSDALVQPNPIWAAWSLNILMDEMEVKMFGNKDNNNNNNENTTNQADVSDVISNEVFGVGVLATILRAAFTPNMSLKDILFRIAGRILNHCVLMYPKHSSSSQKHWRWMTSAKAYLTTAREHRLIRVFTSRYRKEREQSVLCSPYLHSLTALLFSCAEIRTLIHGNDSDIEYRAIASTNVGVVTLDDTLSKKANYAPALEEENDDENDGETAKNEGSLEDENVGVGQKQNGHLLSTLIAPNVIIDEVGVTSISLAWCLSAEDIAAKLTTNQTVKVEVSMAEIPQPFCNGGNTTPHGEGEDLFAFKRLELQRIVPIMDYGGFGVRPRTLSTFVCNDVLADSRYAFRVEMDVIEDNAVTHTILGKSSYVDTKPESLFMLDPNSCGANLVLTNSNMVVTNTVNKKWNAVRASTSFSKGVHYWEVHIDKCVSKNIFVGIMTENGSTDNYVGSDREGWGYLANKAIWHNKGKMCTYGELFREGDHIGVTLDMDCGTVAFSRNGKDLGVAVEGIAGEIYPAFSLYNIDDQVSLVPISSTFSSSVNAKGENEKSTPNKRGSKGKITLQRNSFSLARVLLQTLHETVKCFTSLIDASQKMKSDNTIDQRGIVISKHLEYEVLDFLKRWSKDEVRRYRSVDGESILVDTSLSTCRAYGFLPDETVHTPKGEIVVLGVYNNALWWKMSDDGSISSWSRKSCRELRMAMGPKNNNALLSKSNSIEGTSRTMINGNNNNDNSGNNYNIRLEVSQILKQEDIHTIIEKIIAASTEPWLIPYESVEDEYKPLAALLLVLNYKLEPLLPLVELWRDGCALSASGITPRVSLNGLNTSAPPLEWSCGQAILNFRTLIFPWTKYHLLLSLIEQTGSSGTPPKVRLTLSHGNLNIKSVFRQLQSIKTSLLRQGIEFIVGRPGDGNEPQAQDSCFEIIVSEINKYGVNLGNAASVGILLGLAIRTGNSFGLNLPLNTWEYLCQPLDMLATAGSGSDKGEYDYCVEKLPFSIRQGLLCIIPGQVLPLFTGKEFRDLVCGSL